MGRSKENLVRREQGTIGALLTMDAETLNAASQDFTVKCGVSDISGKGWGDSHNWQYLYTSAGRSSIYKCRNCDAAFGHHYPSTPSIFKAMHDSGVLDKCPAPPKEPSHP